MCSLCHKKIGTSVFAVYPNGSTLVHFVCFRDSQNMKAVGKGSQLRKRLWSWEAIPIGGLVVMFWACFYPRYLLVGGSWWKWLCILSSEVSFFFFFFLCLVNSFEKWDLVCEERDVSIFFFFFCDVNIGLEDRTFIYFDHWKGADFLPPFSCVV